MKIQPERPHPERSILIPDFLSVQQLAELTGRSRKDLYNQHSAGRGPLEPILVKVGGRLGAWRADYEIWKSSQRRLKQPAELQPAA